MSSLFCLILANLGCFVWEANVSEETLELFALWPLQGGFEPWQLLTYAFLHADAAHLFFNMLGLWMFGRDLESMFGGRGLMRLYFASVLTAGLTQLIVASASGTMYPTIGASGGVFGILLAYAVCFPRRMIVLLFPPIPLPAWLFVSLYAVLELTKGVAGAGDNVAHFAHLGGMIGAFLAMRRDRTRSDGPPSG